jgi:hypothetical protein
LRSFKQHHGRAFGLPLTSWEAFDIRSDREKARHYLQRRADQLIEEFLDQADEETWKEIFREGNMIRKCDRTPRERVVACIVRTGQYTFFALVALAGLGVLGDVTKWF